MSAKRKIYLLGEIDAVMFEKFSEQLDLLLEENATKPIEIELCSGGGDEASAFAIYGKMNSSTAPINITAYGEVASAAILVLAGGDFRRADACTTFMVHESSAELDAATKDLRIEVVQLEKAEQAFYSLVAKHTPATTCHQWRTLAKMTYYFNAYEALAAGLVDSVINDTKNRKVRKNENKRK